MLKIDIDGITADELLKLALIGLEQQHRENSDRITALMAHLKLVKTPAKPQPSPVEPAKRSRLSPEARARIAAGQKRRWERAKQGVATVTPSRKRGRPKLTEQTNVA